MEPLATPGEWLLTFSDGPVARRLWFERVAVSSPPLAHGLLEGRSTRFLQPAARRSERLDHFRGSRPGRTGGKRRGGVVLDEQLDLLGDALAMELLGEPQPEVE